MSTSPIDPPISHAVLVPSSAITAAAAGWEVIYANGDMAGAREAAENWALANIGQTPVIMTYSDHCCAATVAEWARP